MSRWTELGSKLTISEWLALASVVVGLLGAGLAAYAATIEVRDNMDEMIGDIARQSKWNGRAAAVALIAGLLVFAANTKDVLKKIRDV